MAPLETQYKLTIDGTFKDIKEEITKRSNQPETFMTRHKFSPRPPILDQLICQTHLKTEQNILFEGTGSSQHRQDGSEKGST